MILQRVRNYIHDLASKQLKDNPDLEIKKKNNGIVSEQYPDAMIEKASLLRNNKENWKNLMAYPTEIWRHCIYPRFNINYLKFCQQSYALTNQFKLRCKLLFIKLVITISALSAVIN